MKKCNTHKLFYQKYPYKILWYSELAHYFRSNDLTLAREALDRCQQLLEENGVITLPRWRSYSLVTREDLFNSQRVYTALVNTDVDYQLRIERGTFILYATDREWLHNLGKMVNAIEWWEPQCELVPNTIVMGKKMKGWEYKITLGSNVPSDFYKWIEKNLDKIKIGKTLLTSISKEYRYLDGYYFYVKNEKMLSLVTLVLGKGIRRIDKIIVEDKNT